MTIGEAGADYPDMGILSDYFVASAAEAKAIDGSIPDNLAKLEAKGFGLMPLKGLGELMGAEALAEGEPHIHGEGHEWIVQPLLPDFLIALAALAPNTIKEHAAELVKDKTLKLSATQVEQIVGALQALAKKAGKRKGVYLWTST